MDLLTLVRFTQFAGLQTGNMILIGRDLYRLSQPMQERLKEASQPLSTEKYVHLLEDAGIHVISYMYIVIVYVYIMVYTYNI